MAKSWFNQSGLPVSSTAVTGRTYRWRRPWLRRTMGLHFDSIPWLLGTSAFAGDNSLPAADSIRQASMPDADIIMQALAYRSKYRTKRQYPRQVLSCLQIVPHPSKMGGDIIRSETTKCLAAKTCHEGYNPIEAELKSVCGK